MKNGTTGFLKTVIVLMGAAILSLSAWGIPPIAKEILEYHVAYSFFIYGVLAVMYATAIPFYYALYQSYRLLIYIDTNTAFSQLSVKALKVIKRCAFSIGFMYTLIMPFFYLLGEFDDAPGIILVGLTMIFAPLVIAFFAAVLQKLLEDAIEIKSENDLTV